MLSAAVASVSLCFPRGTHAQFEIIEKLFGRVSEFTLFLDAGRLTNTDDVTSVQDFGDRDRRTSRENKAINT